MWKLLDRLAGWYIDRRMVVGVEKVAKESGVQLKRAEITPEGYRIDLVAPGLTLLLDEATALLDAAKAENYIEFTMLPRADRTRWRAVRVTLQWLHGESPAEQNARLRAEVAALRAARKEAPSA